MITKMDILINKVSGEKKLTKKQKEKLLKKGYEFLVSRNGKPVDRFS